MVRDALRAPPSLRTGHRSHLGEGEPASAGEHHERDKIIIHPEKQVIWRTRSKNTFKFNKKEIP